MPDYAEILIISDEKTGQVQGKQVSVKTEPPAGG